MKSMPIKNWYRILIGSKGQILPCVVCLYLKFNR